MSIDTKDSESIFNKKYDEFCDDLTGACPEYSTDIQIAKGLSSSERERCYRAEVLKKKARGTGNPGRVLPNVTIQESVWNALSAGSKKAILEYLALLDVSCVFLSVDLSGGQNEAFSQDWVDATMREWRSKMNRVDFKAMADKFTKMFGTEGTALPPLPEKFLKGKLAKMAEDMVREFRPEDFGLSAEDIAACEKDPTRAFEILIAASTENPQNLQKVMLRVAKKLQGKIQSGELRPAELASEAEEMMKDFKENPAFVEMLNSFRSAFSFEEPGSAKKSGHDGEGRLATARARLRKKLEERKKK
jgi:hypothetical protein